VSTQKGGLLQNANPSGQTHSQVAWLKAAGGGQKMSGSHSHVHVVGSKNDFGDAHTVGGHSQRHVRGFKTRGTTQIVGGHAA
jgi:hypothetical protein